MNFWSQPLDALCFMFISSASTSARCCTDAQLTGSFCLLCSLIHVRTRSSSSGNCIFLPPPEKRIKVFYIIIIKQFLKYYLASLYKFYYLLAFVFWSLHFECVLSKLFICATSADVFCCISNTCFCIII